MLLFPDDTELRLQRVYDGTFGTRDEADRRAEELRATEPDADWEVRAELAAETALRLELAAPAAVALREREAEQEERREVRRIQRALERDAITPRSLNAAAARAAVGSWDDLSCELAGYAYDHDLSLGAAAAAYASLLPARSTAAAVLRIPFARTDPAGKNGGSGPPPPRGELTAPAQPLHQPIRKPSMPSANRRWREGTDAYGKDLQREGITKRHRRERVRVPRNAGNHLHAAGLASDPRLFGDAQFRYLLNGPWRSLSENTKAYNWCLLNLFLKRFDNLTVERAGLRFDRTPQRPKLSFTREERRRLLDTARRFGVVHYAMIVLLLTMGLRPSEVRRLTVEGATSDPVTFYGKRRGIEQGLGKVRRVPPHPLFRELLPELLEHRRQVVEGWAGEDPGFLFCHVWKGELAPWGKAWFDRHFIGPVFDAAKLHARFNLSYRARRTFGRVARLEQGHSIEKVARLMGHSDPRTTTGYLGLTEDDDREVIESTRDSYGTPVEAAARERKGGR